MHRVKSSKYIFIILLIICTFIYTSAVQAESLRASSYEINLEIDYPKDLVSDSIVIQNNEDENGDFQSSLDNIYLERFKLRNSDGEEIDPAYIVVETPYIEESLERQHRFLAKRSEDEEGWFKIKISSRAAFSRPGNYTADIYVDQLDWEISLNFSIKPFVLLELPENEFQIEIGDPSQFPLYVSPENYYLNVKCNHYDWSIQAYLEDDGLLSEKEHFLEADKVMYILTNIDQKINYNRLGTDDFYKFRKEENITILSGDDYERGLNSILFAIRIGDSWSDQPAGLYKGTIIFTLIEDYNNNW